MSSKKSRSAAAKRIKDRMHQGAGDRIDKPKRPGETVTVRVIDARSKKERKRDKFEGYLYQDAHSHWVPSVSEDGKKSRVKCAFSDDKPCALCDIAARLSASGDKKLEDLGNDLGMASSVLWKAIDRSEKRPKVRILEASKTINDGIMNAWEEDGDIIFDAEEGSDVVIKKSDDKRFNTTVTRRSKPLGKNSKVIERLLAEAKKMNFTSYLAKTGDLAKLARPFEDLLEDAEDADEYDDDFDDEDDEPKKKKKSKKGKKSSKKKKRRRD